MPDPVARLSEKLNVRHDRLHSVYEAGPCGYGLYRQIWAVDHACEVVSPAHTPCRPGDLIRVRKSATKDVRYARQRVKSFLLPQGRIWGKTAWKRSHRKWLANQSFPHPAQQVGFQTHLNAVEQAEARRDSIEEQVQMFVPDLSPAPVIEALQVLRGVALNSAVILGGETTREGRITKTGNILARSTLIEAAWAYR